MEFWGLLVVAIIFIAFFAIKETQKSDLESDIGQWGPLKPNLICPHCQTKGYVHVKEVKRKKGISGGKATAAVLTLGVSMLATGLSRKERTNQIHCTNCEMTWDI